MGLETTSSASFAGLPSASMDPEALRALVDSASVAIVREFLAKRRYRKTLDTLHSELPSKPEPTTSSAVARQLGLTKLYVKNSKAAQPYPTLLETLAEHLIHKLSMRTSTDGDLPLASPAPPTSNLFTAPPTASPSATAAPQPITNSLFSSPTPATPAPKAAFAASPARPAPSSTLSTSAAPSVPKPSPVFSTPINATATPTRPPVAVTSSALTSSAFSPASLSALSKMRLSNDSPTSTPPPKEEKEPYPSTSASKPIRPLPPHRSSHTTDDADMLMEDVDDDVQRISSRPATHTPTPPHTVLTPRLPPSGSSAFPSETIPLVDAIALRTLVFGPPSATNAQTFSPSWKGQGFFFSTAPTLPYGLVQRDGGPCGLIAAAQAELLRQLLPSDPGKVTEDGRMRALLRAMAGMVWRAAGGQGEARLVLEGKAGGSGVKRVAGQAYKPDGLTEGLVVYRVGSLEAVERWFAQNAAAYVGERGCGLVLLLYSLVLSRGVGVVGGDCDYSGSTLIGQHAYCTQEMVNLALTGVAASNVFDGVKEMDGTQLKGVKAQSAIGFLSLFEHYGYIEVGRHLKDPQTPIWLVCSESHYTTLWSTGGEAAMGRGKGVFDLFYYDQLIQQREEIRLTVDCTSQKPVARSAELEPPLNDCIRTRWGKGAKIDWNGTEPIL